MIIKFLETNTVKMNLVDIIPVSVYIPSSWLGDTLKAAVGYDKREWHQGRRELYRWANCI